MLLSYMTQPWICETILYQVINFIVYRAMAHKREHTQSVCSVLWHGWYISTMSLEMHFNYKLESASRVKDCMMKTFPLPSNNMLTIWTHLTFFTTSIGETKHRHPWCMLTVQAGTLLISHMRNLHWCVQSSPIHLNQVVWRKLWHHSKWFIACSFT